MTKSLLIVDDEESMLKLYTRAFSREGYALTLACSVAEARALQHANHYDLLITDLILGDGAGTDLIKAADEKGGRTRSILVSGSIDEWELPLFTEKYKLTKCFMKPFQAHALLAAVREVLA